jgi:hypothetical protein
MVSGKAHRLEVFLRYIVLKTASLSVIIRLVVGVGGEEKSHDDQQCPKFQAWLVLMYIYQEQNQSISTTLSVNKPDKHVPWATVWTVTRI